MEEEVPVEVDSVVAGAVVTVVDLAEAVLEVVEEGDSEVEEVAVDEDSGVGDDDKLFASDPRQVSIAAGSKSVRRLSLALLNLTYGEQALHHFILLSCQFDFVHQSLMNNV